MSTARGLTDRLTTLWGGFAVFAPDCHLFYAGDTGYSRDFSDMRAHFAHRQGVEQGGGFDIALLPIGAYEPRWFMATQHVNAEEAVKIHHDLGAWAKVVGCNARETGTAGYHLLRPGGRPWACRRSPAALGFRTFRFDAFCRPRS